MAFAFSPSLSATTTEHYHSLQKTFTSSRSHFGTSFLPNLSLQPKRRVRTRQPDHSPSSVANGNGSEEPVPQDENQLQELIDKLDAKHLRWAEIPFSNIEEELRAIDDYEREEDLKPEDVWPKFLRGAAYEYWGQPHLALAQYAKTDQGSGLRRVPELWERRAYNSFKIGKVGEANAYFDVGLRLFEESCGNELHFVHWFYSNFQDYIPKWNGPSAPIQRGICKYCVGDVNHARECFIPEILLKKKDMEHAILWFLASSAKMNGKGRLTTLRDMDIVNETLKDEHESDPRLRLFINLFCAYGKGLMSDVSEAETELSEAIKADKEDDVKSYVYLAVYHDAFTGDVSERDRALDAAIAIGSTRQPNDTENFLFCAARNRISAPPDAKSVEIPERTT